MPADTTWREFQVEVAPADVEALSDRLWLAGVAGIEERAAGERVLLVVAVAGEHADAVGRVLGDHRVDARVVSAEEGLDEWRRYAQATQVGALTIEPAWLARKAREPGRLVVRIDPGHAFGSGAHTTTRLALQLLAAHVVAGAFVLDVGTGSGVLAVAAARFGAGAVVAVDNDEHACAVARENADRNDVSDIVTVCEQISGTFDLVVANITAATLIELAAPLVAAVQRGGWLLLSGMLVDQADAVAQAYDVIEWIDRMADGEWTAMAGRVPT